MINLNKGYVMKINPMSSFSKKTKLGILLALILVLALIIGLAFAGVYKPVAVSPTVPNAKVNKQASVATTPANKNLYPADAASVKKCDGLNPKTLTIPVLYQASGPQPACQEASGSQNLVIINATASTISFKYMGKLISIASHQTYQNKAAFDTYLAKGVHNISFSSSHVSQIWLK